MFKRVREEDTSNAIYAKLLHKFHWELLLFFSHLVYYSCSLFNSWIIFVAEASKVEVDLINSGGESMLIS